MEAARLVNGPVPEDLLRMLEAGQIDLWATGDLAGRYKMKKAGIVPDADTNVTMVANSDNILMVGVNYRGKTGIAGTPLRDEIVADALANSVDWVPVSPAFFSRLSGCSCRRHTGR